MKNPKNIVITGASSGLGAALALHYAAPGVTLYLQGRNARRLQTSAEACRQRGAVTHEQLLDVTVEAAMRSWLENADAATPIDLIIANAGISAGSGADGESSQQVKHIFATNIDGVVHTIQPLLPAMTRRKHGQIAIISSLAGIRGLPSCPAYSASKNAVRAYGEALRGWLGKHRVEVSVVCPGYIRTNMTQANTFPMPMIIDAGTAARKIAAGLARNQSRIAFPLALYLPLYLMNCLPTFLTDPFFARLPAKPSVENPA
jgi:short-subunit dehydrogenase